MTHRTLGLPRPTGATWLLALAALTAAGCSQTPPPAAARPAVSDPTPKTAEVAPPSPPPEAVTPATSGQGEKAKKDPTLVTLDPAQGKTARTPQTLAEVALAERQRRADLDRSGTPTVITNKNLADFAAKGQVTEAPQPAYGGTATGGEPGAGDNAAQTGEAASGEPSGGAAEGPRDEAYWRGRAREIRQRWKQAAEEVDRLEKETSELRWRFYAEDDGYFRDEKIKPEWDRALDDLRRARQDVRAFREELERFLDEGRQAGALPGWLREGNELEPEDEVEEKPRETAPRNYESVEPETLEQRPNP